jgi:pimeloyl-ACP methyl ester carboxylesterase
MIFDQGPAMQTPEITATQLAYFDPGDGRRIAYRFREPKAGGPTVMFLPGYASDMEGAAARL